MAKEKRSIGVKIDKEVWRRFRQDVQDRHGTIRGALGIEVENALIDYIEADRDNDQLTRIEDDLAKVVGILSEREISNADGGSPTASHSESVSTPARDSGKPKANQPRQEKIDYLLTELLADNPCNQQSGQLPKDDIRQIIKSEYDFTESTVDEYMDSLISRLDAKEHPRHGVTVAWGERYEQIVDELREEAEREMDEL